ncbi:MAG: VRR-NUC domain-containing protein [Thermomicrobiales bacterium]|nr:MAG: VRR-NUC domain-containing protein [Thermomicrobiales bacterium]
MKPTCHKVQAALAFYAGSAIPVAAPARKNERPKAAALVECYKALRHHPAVAWAGRFNSGAMSINEGRPGRRFVRFSDVPGLSDLLGQLRDGRLIACEVKSPDGRLSESQAQFLERVRLAGGVAFVARNAAYVMRELDLVIAE